MAYRFREPPDTASIQQVLEALEAELAQREQIATALANKNAELQGELQRRLAESESVNRVLVSLQEQAEQLAVLAERQRLARELHDSVTQSLYSVTLYANAAALALAAGKVDVTAGYLQELQETALEGDARHAAADLPVAPAGAGDGRAGGCLAGPPGSR